MKKPIQQIQNYHLGASKLMRSTIYEFDEAPSDIFIEKDIHIKDEHGTHIEYSTSTIKGSKLID
jgi:hypothetical protein